MSAPTASPATSFTASFTAEIRKIASALGRAPSAAQVADVEDELRSLAIIDMKAGTVTVEIEGNSISVADYIASRAGSFSKVETASKGEAAPASSKMREVRIGNSKMIRRADDPFLKIMDHIEGSKEADLLAEIKTWPNPFAQNTWNRTRQAVMTNKIPALAAKMKAMAG